MVGRECVILESHSGTSGYSGLIPPQKTGVLCFPPATPCRIITVFPPGGIRV